jgi:hypothetical protein
MPHTLKAGVLPRFLQEGGLLADIALSRWPTQARFWLESGSSAAGRSLPVALSCFRAVNSHSIPAHPLQPGDVTTQGPSTPQIIAFAVICSGRDDRVGEIGTCPVEPKPGLSWHQSFLQLFYIFKTTG